MKRREFITLLGGAAAAWLLAARAQQAATPVIGFLHSESPSDTAHLLRAFRQGLGEGGYVEGRNLAVEYRWAESRYERLSALAADLVARHVALIAANGPAIQAARAATRATLLCHWFQRPEHADEYRPHTANSLDQSRLRSGP